MIVSLSTEQRQEMRRLAEAATPGPWRLRAYQHGGGRLSDETTDKRLIADLYNAADRDYFAALVPQTVLALLDALDAGPRSEEAGLDDIAASYEASARTWNRRAAESRGRTSEIAETRAQTWAAAAVDIRARGVLRTTKETE